LTHGSYHVTYFRCSLLSALCSLLSTLYALLSTLYSLLSTLCSLLSTLYSLPSTLNSLLSTLYSLLSTLYSLLSTLYSLLSTLYTLLSSMGSHPDAGAGARRGTRARADPGAHGRAHACTGRRVRVRASAIACVCFGPCLGVARHREVQQEFRPCAAFALSRSLLCAGQSSFERGCSLMQVIVKQ
jgi:hypothetical protein